MYKFLIKNFFCENYFFRKIKLDIIISGIYSGIFGFFRESSRDFKGHFTNLLKLSAIFKINYFSPTFMRAFNLFDETLKFNETLFEIVV